MALEREFQVAWEHLDANVHAANTAFMRFAINTRFLHFASLGFTPADFARHRLGPVVRRRWPRRHGEPRADRRLRGAALQPPAGAGVLPRSRG